MRFKAQSQRRELPEVNLVPMMDVLMTILVFFIIISMTAQINQKAVEVSLPAIESGSEALDQPDPMILQLDKENILFLEGEPIDPEQMAQAIQQYLGENPEGAVVLEADYELTYQDIVEVLGAMRDVGGSRVSLAIAD
ncbi:MAG: biopolymer transporter ExbD [Cyanobacteriota bacterium]|nr:biopolymer transporter ExbD [Cyanobacteriota bacterium]